MIYGLDLFTGIGGITIALQDYVQPLAYCEVDSYAQSVLLQKMQKENLPKAPIWDDIRTLCIKEMPIDIVYGGFPCQDISIAGHGIGLEGKRSGLFFEILRLLDEKKVAYIFLENVPNIRTKGAERVCKELAERGYDCRWCCLSARDVGARHKRERWFLLGYSKHNGLDAFKESGSIASTVSNISKGKNEAWKFKRADTSALLAHSKCEGLHKGYKPEKGPSSRCSWIKQDYWTVEPSICRVAHGISNRVDRIKCLGNSVVPLQVRIAFEILIGFKN